MTQDNKRALALLGDVQTNAVGFDATLYDRASRHSETIARDPATARRYRTTRQAVECLRSFGPRRLCLVARLWQPFGLIRFLFGHFLLRALGRWCRRHCHAIHFSEPAAGKPIDTGPWAVLESQRRLPTATGTPADVDGGRLAQPRDNIAFAHADSDATANERPCIGDAGTRRVRPCPNRWRLCRRDVPWASPVGLHKIVCRNRMIPFGLVELLISVAEVGPIQVKGLCEPGAAGVRTRCNRKAPPPAPAATRGAPIHQRALQSPTPGQPLRATRHHRRMRQFVV